MEYRLLGPFEVRHGEQAVELGDMQQRHLLVLLVLHANRALTAPRMVEILWPNKKPKAPLVATYVTRIRKAFREAGVAEEVLEKSADGYLLRVAELSVDVDQFHELVAQAASTTVSDTRRKLLHQAVTLWRGEFLENLDVDRLGGGSVISPVEAFLDAIGDLAELELDQRNHRWVRDRLRPLVTEDLTRQRLVKLLMRALLANGDRVAAVHLYHRCREALFDELGMEPDRDLSMLHVLAQREAAPSTLPGRPARFTGRGEQLALVDGSSQRALTDEDANLLWISGSAGVGKTALAVQAAHLLRPRFPGGQLFLRLNGFTHNVAPTDTATALAQLLGGLGVAPEQIPLSMDDRRSLYRTRLMDTNTIVVLDDAASEQQIAALLPPAGCFAIVTSRVVAGIQARETIHLAPLPADDAEALFVALVGPTRIRPDGELVTTIAELCGHFPIRIRTMAAQLRQHPTWSLEHLIELIEHNRTSGTAPLDPADAAFSVSYEHLTPAQGALFRLLGHNPGPDLSMPAASALLGVFNARELLDQLLLVSVLDEPTSGRYTMLDPLKDFAAGLAPNAADEVTDALARLVDFYLVNTAAAIGALFPAHRSRQPAVTRESVLELPFPDTRSALDWLTTERLNLIAAARFAAEHGMTEQAWQLPVLLWRYFYRAGYQQDWIDTLELARRTIADDPAHRHGLAHVLLRLSGANWHAGHRQRALDHAEQALPLWQAIGDLLGEAETRQAMAMAELSGGRTSVVAEHFEAALDLYTQLDDDRGRANSLDMLGILDNQRGLLESAQQRHLRAVSLLGGIGETQGLASALNNLGAVRQRLGLIADAIDDHRAAHRLAAEVGNHATEAAALNGIGCAHRIAGRLDDAMRYHDDARAVAEQVTSPNLRTQLYLDRATTHQARDEHAEARRYYLAALDLARGTGDRGKQALARHGVAELLHTRGEHDDAREHWHSAIALFDDLEWAAADHIRSELATLNCDCAFAPEARPPA